TAPADAASSETLAAAVLARVPADAPLVLVLEPQAVLEAFGYAALLEKYSPMASDFIGPMADLVGADPTRPEGWAKLGLDQAAPAGAWLTDLKPSGVVTFVGLKDRKAFEAAIQAIAKKAEVELSSEPVGANTLYTRAGADRLALLTTDEALFFVTLYRGTGAADIARGVAQRTKEQSLLGRADFAALAGKLKSPDGGLLFRFGELLKFEPKTASWLGEGRAELQTQIDEAKKNNNAELVAELTRQLESNLEMEARYNKRAEAEAALTKRIFSGMGEVIAGLDVGPEGIDIDARLPMAADAMVAGLLKKGETPLPVLKLAKGLPLFSVGGQIDVKAGLELLDLMAAADGESLEEGKAFIKAELGLDLDAELFAHLDGRLGFVLTGDLMAALKSGDPSRAMHGAFIAGLAQPDAIKALLAKLPEIKPLAEMVQWDAATSTLKTKLPEDRDVFVTVAGSFLVISTDADAKSNLEGAPTFVDAANPWLKARMLKPGVGAVLTLDQSFVGSWLFAMGGGRGSFMPAPQDGESEETKALRAEIAKLDTEIEALRTQVGEARMRPFIDAFHKLGTSGHTATLGDGHLELTMGLYTRDATLADAVAAITSFAVEGVNRDEPSPDELKLRELENKRWELESQLMRPKSFDEIKPE
ncbi:MAG TPA: hypothetical protein PK095_20355, partial [Myxococcota bacterium]|nr:hypothetical protein [Myxococcota bacterium]